MISISQMKSLVGEVCKGMCSKFASDDEVNIVISNGIV